MVWKIKFILHLTRIQKWIIDANHFKKGEKNILFIVQV